MSALPDRARGRFAVTLETTALKAALIGLQLELGTDLAPDSNLVGQVRDLFATGSNFVRVETVLQADGGYQIVLRPSDIFKSVLNALQARSRAAAAVALPSAKPVDRLITSLERVEKLLERHLINGGG